MFRSIKYFLLFIERNPFDEQAKKRPTSGANRCKHDKVLARALIHHSPT